MSDPASSPKSAPYTQAGMVVGSSSLGALSEAARVSEPAPTPAVFCLDPGKRHQLSLCASLGAVGRLQG